MFVSEATIHPRSVQGRYAQLRWLTVWITQLVFYGLPWLEWGQRQAVLFDLEARRFYLFGLVLYPQDFIFLAGLLIICALSLFLVTAIAGRVWCGYGCPQTVYSEIFMWIERKIEGDRQRRIRLDAQAWNARKIGIRGTKHLIWFALSLWTGLTFVAYFTPMSSLLVELKMLSLGPWETFWILFYAAATYGNAGFMREQVCKYMCPYARFQSAMFDKDTLIVTYDEKRGEPRGGRAKSSDAKAQGLGDCVDCTLCVQVCPTGIDIRKGLQYECIGCAACIDVCNGVMKRLDYAPGLIRYSTQQAMDQGWSAAQIWQRIRRPRVLVYIALWLAICAGWLVSLSMRDDFKVDVVRDRGVLARIVSGGMIENVYRINLMNATDTSQSLQISATGLPGLQLKGDTSVRLVPAQSQWIVVRLELPISTATQLKSGSHAITLRVVNEETQTEVLEKSIFYIPR
jgi:cytochrome c oxidase accessory protein FixG